MSAEMKTEKFMMIMEPALLKEIDDWRFANRANSRAEAVRRIVRIGLDKLPHENAIASKAGISVSEGTEGTDEREIDVPASRVTSDGPEV